MPDVGDVVQGRLIGRSNGRYIYVRCPDCDERRWISFKPYDPGSTRRCQRCHVKFVRKIFTTNKAKQR